MFGNPMGVLPSYENVQGTSLIQSRDTPPHPDPPAADTLSQALLQSWLCMGSLAVTPSWAQVELSLWCATSILGQGVFCALSQVKPCGFLRTVMEKQTTSQVAWQHMVEDISMVALAFPGCPIVSSLSRHRITSPGRVMSGNASLLDSAV